MCDEDRACAAVSTTSTSPDAAAAATPATEENEGDRRAASALGAVFSLPVSFSFSGSVSKPSAFPFSSIAGGAGLLTAASAACAGLGGGAPRSAARMKLKNDDPRCHAMVSITRSSIALKCFFTSLGMVGSARTNGSIMCTTSKASRPSNRGMAGNFRVAVLYDATTTSMAHDSTARTNRLDPASCRYAARCDSLGSALFCKESGRGTCVGTVAAREATSITPPAAAAAAAGFVSAFSPCSPSVPSVPS